VLLYDFDSVTGTVSNGITLISNSNPYGVEFSTKKKLYVTENHFDSGGDKIVESPYSIRFKNTNIPSSKTVIETSPLYISGATIGH
jgi:hypothetical protein